MTLEHLISVWPKVAAQLKGAKHILLLTDYDGTLTPIALRPELADLPEGTRRSLRALASQRRITVGVISGRALADLRDKVGVSGIIYAGNHGLEIEGPGIHFVNPAAEEARSILRILYNTLTRAVGTTKGVLIENKGLGISVHYRLVEERAAREVERIVKRAIGSAHASGKVRMTPGKKVYEVRPAVAWDKGKAIELLVKKYGKGARESGLLPIYLGDDQTDEDGFRVVKDSGVGISVFVGEEGQHQTDSIGASYFLKSPTEVAAFLEMLLEQLQRSEEGDAN